MTVLIFLSYAAPVCCILGFIVSPGLTIIYPWLREKFDDDVKETTRYFLETDFTKQKYYEVYKAERAFKSMYKWDWRPKIRRKAKELKNLRIFREKKFVNGE